MSSTFLHGWDGKIILPLTAFSSVCFGSAQYEISFLFGWHIQGNAVFCRSPFGVGAKRVKDC